MKKETKRGKIIRAAVQLLCHARHINKVSIEDIAREANVSPTTIYNNFGDKETLLIEIIKQIGMDAMKDYQAIVKADMPFPEKIQLFVNQKTAALSEMDWTGIYKLLAHDARLAEHTERIQKEEVDPMFLELIEDGRRQGYIEPGLSAEGIMLYLDILREGAQVVSRIPREMRENVKIMQDLNDIAFHGFVRKDILEPGTAKK